MLILKNVRDLEKMNLPYSPTLYLEVKKVLVILDEAYGVGRNINDDGGYVIVVETTVDLLTVNQFHIKLNERLPEFVELIREKSAFVHLLYLNSNDFGVSLFIPLWVIDESPFKEFRERVTEEMEEKL